MTSQVFYDNVNEIALLTNTFFNSSNVAADPTTVSCIITDPSNASVTHTFGGAAPADITKVSTGIYNLAIPCSPSVTGVEGLWGFEWIGTGAVSDVQPGTWRVLPATVSQLWYTGLTEFKDRLGITDTSDDYQITIAIQSAATYINEYCGRHFNRITETRTYRPYNVWVLDVDDIVPGTSIQVNVDRDGGGVFSEAWTLNVDYQLFLGDDLYNVNVLGIARPYRKIQVIQTGKWFPFTWPYTHLDRVQVITTWGWPSVPPAITQASFLLSAELFKLKDAPFGLSGNAEFGVLQVRSNPMINQMLERFVNPRHKVGV